VSRVYRLCDVQATVQQTAEAIAEVLKIEVEIADHQLVRVAGTGKCQNGYGQIMTDGFVYRYVLQTGEALINDDPGHHPLCKPCIHWGNCSEVAEVASPIKVSGQTIGVIGLISYDADQAKRLLDNKASLLRFLEKMADLLAGKILENYQNQQRTIMTNQLVTVVNLLHDGILMVNKEKMVTHVNQVGCKMFGITKEQKISLDVLVDDRNLWATIVKGEHFSGQITAKKMAGRLFCDAFVINTIGQVEGAVIVLKDMQQVKKLVKAATVSEIETNFSQILGESTKIKEAKELALRVAATNSTILIQGESGTGKEMFARSIHQCSERRRHGFIAINCGAIPENLLESELFGYEEGAFTGAQRGGKLGKFELAHHGTIFLDEIGDMPLHLQVKLLRVLQDKRIERIGGTRSIPVDVRVIAATNRDLEQLIETDEFREDLYYRLHVIPLYIPTLRDRREDIPLLTQFFVEHYSKLLGKLPAVLTSEVEKLLAQYCWPGNVRELANVIEYAVTMATGKIITAELLPKRIKNTAPSGKKELSINLKTMEREAIVRALERAVKEKGNKDEAAKMLGISRATLYRKIKEHKILETRSFCSQS
jgi:sigma-54 dependent transcriptional regulator, acetoin dehydrogenase operon transcriptional activator AcoR